MKKIFGIFFAIVLLSVLFLNNTIINFKDSNQVEELKVYQPFILDTRYNYGPGEFDSFTDKNRFTYNGKDYEKTMQYKEANLYASTTNITYNSYSSTNYREVSGDDPIVNIIPRELFNCRGDYEYCGAQYGFFVHSEGAGEYANIVTVLVFDISQTKLKSDSTNMDAISSKVEVLFQYRYLFFMQNDNGGFCFDGNFLDVNGLIDISYTGSMDELAENGNTLVAAAPESRSFLAGQYYVTYWHYGETDKYALTDIAFQKDLVNEQHADKYLNFSVSPAINNSYVAANDMGNFIIRSDYSFTSSKTVNNADVYNYYVSLFGLVTSFIPQASSVGIMFGGIGLGQASYSLNDPGTVTYDSKLRSQCFRTTKPDQIDKYGELIKSNVNGLDTSDAPFSDKVIFKASGQNAKAEFTLSRNANWHTRVKNTVSVSVVKVIRDWFDTYDTNYEPVMTNYGTYIDYADDDAEHKDLDLNTYNDVTLLQGGKDYYAFMPQYSGTYVINIPDNVDVKIFDINKNNVDYQRNGDAINVYLKGGTEYNLNLSFFDKTGFGTFGFYITIEDIKLDETKEISIDANDKYIIAFNPLSTEVYKFRSNSSVRISVLKSDEYGFYTVNNSLSNYIFQPALSGEKLYILFQNISNAKKTTDISVGRPESLDENVEYTEYINTEFMYYKFTAETSGYYTVVFEYGSGSLSVGNLPSQDLNIGPVYEANKGGCKIANFYLQAGQAYYLGAKFDFDNDAKNINIKFSKAENTYQWIVGSKGAEQEAFFDQELQGYTLKIARGESKVINLVVGGYYFSNYIYDLDAADDHSFGYNNISDNYVLTIYQNVQLYTGRNAIHFVAAKDSEIIPLYIIVTYDLNPVFETYKNSSSDFGLKWTKLSNSEFDKKMVISYSILGVPAVRTMTVTNLKIASNMAIPTSYLSGIQEFRIIVIDIVLTSEYKGLNYDVLIDINDQHKIHNIEIPNILKINPYFSGGDGTSSNPFTIKTADDFKNINKDPYLSYKLIDSFWLTGNWTPISNFYGTLDGNGNTIYSLNISASAAGNYGLVGINRGTIKNLTLMYTVIDISTSNSSICVGAFAGINYGTISNCETIGSSTYNTYHIYFYNYNSGSYMGGIAGYNTYIISSCRNGLILSGYGNIGGIVGCNNASVSNCTNTGYISYSSYSVNSLSDNKSIGGIVGIQIGNGTKTQNCISIGGIIYANTNTTGNTYLKPHMGRVIGWIQAGDSSYNTTYAGTVDTSRLTASQKTYAGDKDVGRAGS